MIGLSLLVCVCVCVAYIRACITAVLASINTSPVGRESQLHTRGRDEKEGTKTADAPQSWKPSSFAHLWDPAAGGIVYQSCCFYCRHLLVLYLGVSQFSYCTCFFTAFFVLYIKLWISQINIPFTDNRTQKLYGRVLLWKGTKSPNQASTPLVHQPENETTSMSGRPQRKAWLHIQL